MKCLNCGGDIKPKNRFCEHCGTAIARDSRVSDPDKRFESNKVVLNQETKTSHSTTKVLKVNQLQLQAWAGWTWLIAKNYGELAITETHLEYDIKKFWASNLWSILSKIFSWGFDWQTSLWVGRGSSDLRAVSNVKIYALDWLAWRAHVLVIFTTGIPSLYFFSVKQIHEVETFVENLKYSTANAKFVTKVGS